ncbi:MAG: 50S ribosomal protein L6 [bacterium]
MSRIGKQPIPIPETVQVTLEDGRVGVKGPKGELNQNIPAMVKVVNEDQILKVSVANPDEKSNRAIWGLFQRLINNMVIGVVQGFEKKLEINGVGFQATVKGNNLVLNLGYSHPIDFPIPEGITISVEKNLLTVTGIEKQKVGEVAAQIRGLRKPEPYKGKGIKYLDEVIRRKAGKQASGTSSE